MKSVFTMFVSMIVTTFIMMLLGGCSTGSKRDHRTTIETQGGTSAPDWATGTKLSWEEGDAVAFKGEHTVRGTDRVNGCFDLAKLDVKEAVLSELVEDVRGRIDQAQQSLSEDAEQVLGKVRSASYAGKVTGLRFVERFFERYRIGDSERLDCFVMAQMSKSDYARLKRSLVDELSRVDPQLHAAIAAKQVEFFSGKDSKDRVVSSPKQVGKEVGKPESTMFKATSDE
jgi:hypothetical protein